MTSSIHPFSSTEPPRVAPKAVKADEPKPPEPLRRGKRAGDLIDGKQEYKLVLLSDIERDPDQPRKIFRNIQEMAASMRQNGLLQPITCRIDARGELVLMYGERRWLAAQLLAKDPNPEIAAQWTHIPTMIRYGVPDPDLLAKQLVENVGREKMDPMDEARAVVAYMRQHKISTYQDAADRLGLSLAWVAGRAALVNLDEEDQEAVSKKDLPVLEAVKKARVKMGVTRTSKKQRAAEENGEEHSYSHYTAQHFSDEHFLAGRAKSRCVAAQKSGEKHKPLIGGIACGACWEVVIRLDARRNPDALAGTTH